MKHGVVLVGLGAIGLGYDLGDRTGERVCSHARAFSVHPSFELLAAVDPDPRRREAFTARYGRPAYETLGAALEEHSPEVVVIATPTGVHHETLQAVLEHATPKLILCEKPLAHELDTAREMVAVCERRNVALYVNYMRRSDPGVRAVANMIDAGAIGTPLKGVAWYSKGLIHNGSHFVDLARNWFGPVRQAHLIRAGRRWQDHDPEPDFLLECERGSITFLAASEERFSHYTLEVVAQNGRLRYEQGGERMEWQEVVDDPDFPGYRVLAPQPQRLPADLGRYQLNVASQLSLALAGAAASLCSGQEALQTLRDVYRVLELL